LDVREFVPFSALDDIVQYEDGTIVAGFEYEDVLILALLVVQDLIDLKSHGLAGPHIRYLTEPAICSDTVSSAMARRVV
jgi:hypothetical protein